MISVKDKDIKLHLLTIKCVIISQILHVRVCIWNDCITTVGLSTSRLKFLNYFLCFNKEQEKKTPNTWLRIWNFLLIFTRTFIALTTTKPPSLFTKHPSLCSVILFPFYFQTIFQGYCTHLYWTFIDQQLPTQKRSKNKNKTEKEFNDLQN